MSRNPKNTVSSRPYDVDGRWENEVLGSVLVEVRRTHSLRDVRDVLLTLAYLLSVEPARSQAICVVIESRLSDNRLREEMRKFRDVIHSDIAQRIHFLVDRGSPTANMAALERSMPEAPKEFYEWMSEVISNEKLRGHALHFAPRQVVIATLAQLRLWNESPVTVKKLQETCDVSYPTVAQALKELADRGMLESLGERGIRLRHLTSGEWIELATEHAKQRKVHLFTDPTAHATPEQLARRLRGLQEKKSILRDARIGGVMGASHHFPELDITAAPRLDLSVETDPANVAAILDAGLVAKTKPDQRVALAVHLTRHPTIISNNSSEISKSWAGELECLADLIELRFTREASEMARHLEVTNSEAAPHG